MSRIGKLPLQIPNGVQVSFADSVVTVKGPKGTLTQKLTDDISLTIDGTQLTVTRPTEQKRHRALHGLYRALINNMVTGVSTGFKVPDRQYSLTLPKRLLNPRCQKRLSASCQY